MADTNIIEFPNQNRKKPKNILINISACIIALVLIFVVCLIIGQIQIQNSGFDDKDILVTNYFTALNNTDKSLLKKCFYPTNDSTVEDIETQLSYAQSEKEQITWDPDNIEIEWTEADIDFVQQFVSAVVVEDAALSTVFVPLEQVTSDGVTVKQEDVYQIYAFLADEKWYIASFVQIARDATGAIDADGNEMTSEEFETWLYSLATEIGSDTVGYLFVDGYWSEVINEDYADDDQIKTYLTDDGTSYLTMAVIKDTDIDNFNTYSQAIIENSDEDYGDILESTGVIGDYDTDVQIAQNEETGARIIVWVFKTDDTSDMTHVITLEAKSDYDASTYINTFHLTKQHTDDE